MLLDQLEASAQHRRDIIACWLDIYNLIGQCFGHVSERNKKAAHVKHEGIFATLRQMSHDIQENARTITDLDVISIQNEYANAYGFIISINSISRDIELFDYPGYEKPRSSLILTYLGPGFHQHSVTDLL